MRTFPQGSTVRVAAVKSPLSSACASAREEGLDAFRKSINKSNTGENMKSSSICVASVPSLSTESQSERKKQKKKHNYPLRSRLVHRVQDSLHINSKQD